jgi:N-acetylmuramoyl-L-alanine amidase
MVAWYLNAELHRFLPVLRIPLRYLWLGLLCLIFAGCQSAPYHPRTYPDVFNTPVSDDISINDLAQRLHLQVTRTNDTYVTLTNARNTVLVFSHSDGAFYVNGEAGGKVGRTRMQGEVLYVESSLVQRLKSLLKPEEALPPAVAVKPSHPTMRGIVVVDPGHGGKDPGTTSVLGFKEKEINLAVGLQLAGELREKGFEVIMTRDSDRFIELEERVDLANRHRADLFISVHADYCDTPGITGFTVYTAKDAPWRTRQAAQSIKQALLDTGQQTRGIRQADYRVLVKTQCPAVLVELGYLSNYWESRRLRDTGLQGRLAQAIAQGALALWSNSPAGNSPAVAVSGQGPLRSFSYPIP